MRRREFIILLGAGAAAWPLAARAQQTAVPVIGYLGPSTAGDLSIGWFRAFHQGLKESGYVEGENVTIDYRWAENQPDRLSVLAADLVRRPVNVIAALSAPASLAAAKATMTIPIVFMVPEDPVRLGLVVSLSRPGGNMTGVNFFAAELAAKRLELRGRWCPQPRAWPCCSIQRNRRLPQPICGTWRQLPAPWGYNSGFSTPVASPTSTPLSRRLRARPDGVFISSGPFFTYRRVQLAHLATRYAIPAIHGSRGYPEVGGLMSYGTSRTETLRQAGVYAGRILKGAKPGDLPVVQSTKFEFVINIHAAQMLGLVVPPSLLAAADEVIE